MNPKISVLVLCRDGKYLTRCLNSIKRQNYQDVEIIVLTEEISYLEESAVKYFCLQDGFAAGINQAIQSAEGEFILLCNASAILSSDVLNNLMLGTKNSPDCLAVTTNYIADGAGYKKDEMNLSMYGKLFSKSVIQEHGLLLSGDALADEYAFVTTYLGYCSAVIGDSVSGLYDDDSTVYSIIDENGYVLNLFNRILQNDNLRHSLERENKHVDNKYFSSQELEVRYSFGVWEDDKYGNRVVLLKNEWPKAKCSAEMAKNSLASEPSALYGLSGVHLADYIVDRFGNGDLGLKTVIKATLAWLKFKLGRKK